MDQQQYKLIKQKRRDIKQTEKRKATANEVIYIFEKILEGWKTIRIYNTIIQENPNSNILKKNVEQISTGNCKINETELTKERYLYYTELRKQVYDKFKDI
jgi:hypothetical protein